MTASSANEASLSHADVGLPRCLDEVLPGGEHQQDPAQAAHVPLRLLQESGAAGQGDHLRVPRRRPQIPSPRPSTRLETQKREVTRKTVRPGSSKPSTNRDEWQWSFSGLLTSAVPTSTRRKLCVSAPQTENNAELWSFVHCGHDDFWSAPTPGDTSDALWGRFSTAAKSAQHV